MVARDGGCWLIEPMSHVPCGCWGFMFDDRWSRVCSCSSISIVARRWESRRTGDGEGTDLLRIFSVQCSDSIQHSQIFSLPVFSLIINVNP